MTEHYTRERKRRLHDEITRRQPSYKHSIPIRSYERSSSLGLNSNKSSSPIKHRKEINLYQTIKEVKKFEDLPESHRRDDKIQNTCDRDLITKYLKKELTNDKNTFFVTLSCAYPNTTTLKNIVKIACQRAEGKLNPINKHTIRDDNLLPKIDCYICKQETYHLHIYFRDMEFKDFLYYINCLSYLFIKVYPHELHPVEYHNLIDSEIGSSYIIHQFETLITEKDIFRFTKKSIIPSND